MEFMDDCVTCISFPYIKLNYLFILDQLPVTFQCNYILEAARFFGISASLRSRNVWRQDGVSFAEIVLLYPVVYLDIMPVFRSF